MKTAWLLVWIAVRNGLLAAVALLPATLSVFLGMSALTSAAGPEAPEAAAADPLACGLVSCSLLVTQLVIPLIVTALSLARVPMGSGRRYLIAGIAVNWGALVLVGLAAYGEFIALPVVLGDPAITRAPGFAEGMGAYLENMAVLSAVWYTITGALAGTAASILSRGRQAPEAA